MTTYYGFEHAYGAQMSDGNGGDLGECHAFPTRADRDQWVSERTTEYTTERGYREAYPAKRARAWLRAGMVFHHTDDLKAFDVDDDDFVAACVAEVEDNA